MDHNEKNADSDRARVVATSCLLIITVDETGAASNYVQRTLRACNEVTTLPQIINFPTINILARTLMFYMTHYHAPTNE